MSKRPTNLVVASFENTPMTFREDGWFNATVAAEKFGKRVNDFMALPTTHEYLNALTEDEAVNTRLSGISDGARRWVMAKRGKNGGTWMHPDLAVAFARWLDMRFSIWCDRQIKALLAGQHPHHDRRHLRQGAAASHNVMCDILKLVRQENGKDTAPHHYSNEARLVNWALTGMFQPVDRESLSDDELEALIKLEEQNAVMIGRGVDYRFRKSALDTLARVLLLPQRQLGTGP